MGRIDIDHEIGVCELSPEVKKARRPEIFSTLPTSQERARVFTKWMTSFEWRPEDLPSCLEKIQREDITEHTEGISEATVRHLQSVMALPDVVGNITQNYIGRFLQKVEEESETHSQRDLMMGLGNIAEDLKLQDYKRCLEQCAASNCTQCQTANDWEGDPEVRRQQPQRPRPCTSTQVLTSLREKAYTNAHATYYK